MTSDWPVCTLEEVADDITVGHVGPMVDEYIDNGVPFLRSLNVEPFNIHLEDIKYISKEFHQKIRKSALKPGDVVIVRTGKPGACAVIPDWLSEANCSDLVVVRPGPNLNPFFLMYYVNSIASHHVDSHLVGAVQQHFNVASAREIVLYLPPLPIQRRIAHILGSLDDKIELNRQMNETLEAMARAIFKSWFVDFDPVRAKEEGRQPAGMDAVTAALFPDGFEVVDGREVPKGWGVEALSESFNVIMGQSPPGTTYNENGEGMPFFQGRADFGFRYPSVRVYCTAPIRFAEAGDTLVSVRAPVGDINVAQEKCSIGRGVAAVRHKTGSRSFTYYHMQSFKETFDVFESEGTVFGSIAKTDFNSMECISPPDEIVRKFEEIVFPVDQMIENNEQQSRTLAQMRDALLPKLMGGEISIPLNIGQT